MTWMAAGIGGSALVGAGGSIFSSLMGASGAKKSAEAIRYAADVGSKTALELNARSRADLAPFRDLGVQSGRMISDIYSGKANLDQLFKSSSLYQFESDYGTRALNRQLTARGQFGSGAGLESLALFDKSLVAEQGNDYFNKLMGTTNLGEGAAAQQSVNNTSMGNTLANLQLQAGQGIGQAYQNQYNAYGNIGTGIANAAQQGVTNWTNYSLYNPVLQRLAQGNMPNANEAFAWGPPGGRYDTQAQRDSLAATFNR
jgi:hypothetical protein